MMIISFCYVCMICLLPMFETEKNICLRVEVIILQFLQLSTSANQEVERQSYLNWKSFKLVVLNHDQCNPSHSSRLMDFFICSFKTKRL